MQSHCVTSDFDGTFTDSETGLDVARLAGREKEAKDIYGHMMLDCSRIVREAKSPEQMMNGIESTYKTHLIAGGKLLGGQPASILSQVKCDPSKSFESIVEIAKKAGRLRVVTYTDEEIVSPFMEKNKEKIPNNYECVCSKLETVGGKLTGNFLRITSKARGYPGGDVFEDSVGGIRLCNEAHKRGYNVHVVRDGEKTKLIEEALRKIGVTPLYLAKD